MDKTINTDSNMEGAAACVNSLLKDPDVGSSTAEALAMVFIEGKSANNRLTSVVASEVGSLKSRLQEQDEAILDVNEKANKNSSDIAKHGVQISALYEQIKTSAVTASSNEHLFATEMGCRVSHYFSVCFPTVCMRAHPPNS